MQKYFDSVSSGATGLPVFRAQITVTDGNGIPVQIYSDNGMTVVSQPLRTDIFGFFSFFVPDGVYTITTADPNGNNPRSVPNVEIFDNSNIAAMTAAAIDNALNTLVYPKLQPSITNYPIFQYNPSDLRDMGPIIQTALNAGVRDFSGVNLYINSAVVIPNNVTITWAPQGEIIPKSDGYFNRTGIWVLGPNANINWGRTTVLMNPAVVHRDFMAPPVITGDTATDTAAAKARLDARTSNGTAMMLNRPDVLVFNPLIVGFNKAIIINAERVRVIEARIDCTNAIEGYGISDVCYVNDAHIWPYWAAHNATITLAITASYNTGLYFHDQADGVQINGGLIYGMATSVRYSNVYALKAKGVWIDGDAATNAARGSIGVLTENNCQFLDISHTHVDSQAYSRKLTHSAGLVIWSDNTSSNAQTADTILGTGHSRGSVEIQAAKGSALITLNAGIGIHDLEVSASGGSATQVLDVSAVTPASLLSRVSVTYTNIGCPAIDNTGILPPAKPSSATATSTYDAAPAIILPASTPTLMLNGKTTPGDYPELAAYRLVASQPSHQGYIQVGGQYYELIGGHACPDHFMRTGDTDDCAAWLRARDYMIAKNLVQFQMGARTYDIRSQQIDLSGLAIQMIGHGYKESGKIPASPYGSGYVNGNFTQFGNIANGTWVLAGNTGFRNIKLSSGDARGASLTRFGFCQIHPTPASGWAPTPYDYILDNTNAGGGINLDDLMWLGVFQGVINVGSGRLRLGNNQGQWFANAFYIDQCYDKAAITGRIDNWPYLSGNANVLASQQAGLKLFRIGRCDGLMASGSVFSLCGYATVSYENLSNSGAPTDQFWNQLYTDFSQYGVRNDVGGTTASFNMFKVQHQQSTGSANITGGFSVYHTSNAAGGNFRFTNFRTERADGGAVYNAGSVSNTILGPAEIVYATPGAQMFQSPSGLATALAQAPITDTASSNLGTIGVDYVLTDNEIIYEFSGTSDASGNFTLSVPSDSAFQPSLFNAFAVVKNPANGAGRVMQPVDTSSGSLAFVTNNSTFANAPVRGNYRRRRYPLTW